MYSATDKTGQLKLAISQQLLPNLPSIPVGNYSLIVLDPPWQYSLRETDASHRGRCLSLGFQCLESWGFVYKSIFTWVKTTKASTEEDPKLNIGIGHYGRNCTEHWLVATKGKPGSFTSHGLTNIPNVIHAPRGRHSQKPEEFWTIADRLAEKLGGKNIELFARERRSGWDAWGAEIS